MLTRGPQGGLHHVVKPPAPQPAMSVRKETTGLNEEVADGLIDTRLGECEKRRLA